jgi:hypothetical protein
MPPLRAQAQAWPAKSVRLVVNFAAGGSTDVIARAMQAAEAKTHLDAMAAEVIPPMTPAAFATHQQRARDRFGEVVRQAGIKANWACNAVSCKRYCLHTTAATQGGSP